MSQIKTASTASVKQFWKSEYIFVSPFQIIKSGTPQYEQCREQQWVNEGQQGQARHTGQSCGLEGETQQADDQQREYEHVVILGVRFGKLRVW